MFAPGQVEAMLRNHGGSYCSIQLFRELDSEGWSASVNYYDPAKLVRPDTMTRSDDDPVVALGKALIEDERLSKDVGRRYAEAPKAGAQIDIEEAIAAAVDDLMGLVG